MDISHGPFLGPFWSCHEILPTLGPPYAVTPLCLLTGLSGGPSLVYRITLAVPVFAVANFCILLESPRGRCSLFLVNGGWPWGSPSFIYVT